MVLISKTAMVKWNPTTRKHYESKGYIFTKWREEFEVNPNDLTQYSTVKVDVKCDCKDCKNPHLKPIPWANYIRYIHEGDKYYCSNCAKKLFGVEKQKKINLKNSISFEQWCYDNLDIDYANEILSRWDTEKNGCLPSEVSYCSTGFNKKGYWFKCLNNPEHGSEQKRITNFINGHLETMDCNQCNSFAQWGIDNLGEDFLELYWDYDKNEDINPWSISWGNHKKVYINCQEKDYHGSYYVACKEFSKGKRCPCCAGNQFKLHPFDSIGKYLEDNNLLHLWSDKNEKSPYEYSLGSKQEVWWKCMNGVHSDYLRNIKSSNSYEFRCPDCQSKLGETKISEYLMENSIDYIPQMKFEGLYGIGNGKLSYDFYLPKSNLIIEFQGEQHDRPIDFGGYGIEKAKENFKKQQEHDRRKKEYTKKNNIELLEIWYYDYNNIEKILSEYIIDNK